MKNQINLNDEDLKVVEIKTARIEKNHDGKYKTEPVLYFPELKEVVTIDEVLVILNSKRGDNIYFDSYYHKGGGYYKFQGKRELKNNKYSNKTTIGCQDISAEKMEELRVFINKHLGIKQQINPTEQIPIQMDLNDSNFKNAHIKDVIIDGNAQQIVNFPNYTKDKSIVWGAIASEVLELLKKGKGHYKLDVYFSRDNELNVTRHDTFEFTILNDSYIAVGCKSINLPIKTIIEFIEANIKKPEVVKQKPEGVAEPKPTYINVNSKYLRQASVLDGEMVDSVKTKMFIFPYLYDGSLGDVIIGAPVNNVISILKLGIRRDLIIYSNRNGKGWRYYGEHTIRLRNNGNNGNEIGYGNEIGCQSIDLPIDTIIKFLEQ